MWLRRLCITVRVAVAVRWTCTWGGSAKTADWGSAALWECWLSVSHPNCTLNYMKLNVKHHVITDRLTGFGGLMCVWKCFFSHRPSDRGAVPVQTTEERRQRESTGGRGELWQQEGQLQQQITWTGTTEQDWVGSLCYWQDGCQSSCQFFLNMVVALPKWWLCWSASRSTILGPYSQNILTALAGILNVTESS